MKLLNLLLTLIITVVVNTELHAQSRDDERRQPSIEIKMLADAKLNDTWFKAAKVGSGKDFSIISEYFISDQFIADHDLEVERLDEMDLVELYETLFSGIAPFKLIDAVAEKEALELEMMDWEFVGVGNAQSSEDCDSDGKPDWPKTLYPCLDPIPFPAPPDGRPSKPPEPPADGKPLPDYYCWDERHFINALALPILPIWHSGADYFCNYFQASAVLEDTSYEIDYRQRVFTGTTKLKALMKKSGNWVGKQNTFLGEENHTDDGWYYYKDNDGITGKDIIFRIQPAFEDEQTIYHWRLEVYRMFEWTLNPVYPSVYCLLNGIDDPNVVALCNVY